MKEFEDYLNERIKSLSREYSSLLTEIGENTNVLEAENNNELWKKVNDKKSRLEELKETLKIFKEQKYTNP